MDYQASDKNLYNFYTWLDLCCKPKRATALIAMFVFAGSAIGCLFMPRLGDIIGRKTIFCVSLSVQVPLLASLTVFRSLPPVYAAAFLFGICVVGRMANGFLLMMELCPTEHQAKAGAGLMIAEGSTAIIWTIYFLYISQSALPFLWFCTILNLITAILCFNSTESPRFLYCTQQWERLEVSMNKIARWNGVKDYECPNFDVSYDFLVEVPDGEEVGRGSELNGSGDVEDKTGGQNFDHLGDDEPGSPTANTASDYKARNT